MNFLFDKLKFSNKSLKLSKSSLRAATGLFSFALMFKYGNHTLFSQSGKVDYNQLKQDIINGIWDDNFVDHNYGPILVRLAWHASGTYDKHTKTGGSNGATMRFKTEANHSENGGLNLAREFLDTIKKKHPNISYADLWIYASYVAIESMGGPHIDFVEGRVDYTDEKMCPPDGRLPDASKGKDHIRDIFYRMGFNDQEIVVLVGGGHAIGSCHVKNSGYEGFWTPNPILFGNFFFKELFERDWVLRNWKGKKQFEDKQTKTLMMLPTDMEFRDDPEFAKWSIKYQNDSELFSKDFAAAFKKLTELGFVKNI